MSMGESTSLICVNRHYFDISKNGSIHLLSTLLKPTKYDKTMFEARRVVFKSGLYRKMTEPIIRVFSHRADKKHAQPIKIMDAGCGEGSHLALLIDALRSRGHEALGVGIDLSKEGIRMASRNYPGHIWCVADLAQCPFMDRQYDMILNIFSPSNYSEFVRLLHEDGFLVKVVPETGYLKELREAFYPETYRQTYSNERVVAHFSKHFCLVEERRIRYTERLDTTGLENLIHMLGESRKQRFNMS